MSAYATEAEGGGTEGSDVFLAARAALVAWQGEPGSERLFGELRAALRTASATVARLPRQHPGSPLASATQDFIRELSASGAHDFSADPADVSCADKLAHKGWPGLLAGVLLVPAWQWPNAPLLQAVPAWLRPDYVAWLFAAPLGFAAIGHAEAYAAHTLRRLEELERWVNRGPGATAEAAVLEVFANQTSVIPLYFSVGNLRRHAEVRGRLLARICRLPGEDCDATPTSRAGRRLRVGIVNRHFGPQTETYTTLPTFEQLDPERFEVILFTHLSRDSQLEGFCRQHAADFQLLPEDLEGQLAMLRAAALDVVVFGTNLTAVFNEVTRLALHRVAPLQVVNNSSCITSGLPEVDLYVSGTLTETAGAAADFSERLGLLPGPAHAFDYEADRQPPQAEVTRAKFGLPEDAFVFVSAANYFKIIPEMQHAWARLLAAVPGSRLLLHPFNHNWLSVYPVARFRAEFSRVLERHGVEASRLAISTEHFPSRTDVKTLLGLGNAYLDTFPFGGVNSLVDPLELGLPVVVWEGQPFRSRMGGALLRTLDLSELIATNEADYQAIAVKLATDAGHREGFGARIRERMERTPVFLDPLAASEAFGDLVETAYDELVAVGRAAFRANPAPLRTAPATLVGTGEAPAGVAALACETLRVAPANPAARHAHGRALLDAGRAGRAVSYLLAALQGQENKAGLWLDLAAALRAEGQVNQAIEALEAGLRVDDKQLEGWLMLAELAHAIGATDLARDAAVIAQKLAPTDARAAVYLQSPA